MLDTLVALLLLATLGLALLSTAAARTSAMRQALAREAEWIRATALLSHLETLSSDELSRMVGRREHEGLRLAISLARKDLFVVEIGVAGRPAFLSSAILRLEPTDDADR